MRPPGRLLHPHRYRYGRLAAMATERTGVGSPAPVAPMVNVGGTGFPTTAGATVPPPLANNPFPLVMLPSRPDSANRDFYSLSEGRLHTLHLPELQGKHVYAAIRGWLVVGGRGDSSATSPSERFLLNPLSRARKELPPWEFPIPMRHVSLLSSPGSPDCVVAAGTAEHVFLCRPGIDSHWSPLKTTDADGNLLLGGCSDVVAHKMGFYFLRLDRKLLEMEFEGQDRRESVLDMDCGALPPASQCQQSYLVESEGELLLVLVHMNLRFCVFMADFESGAWVPVGTGRLDDRNLFVGSGCSVSMRVPAGSRGGRVFLSYPPHLLGQMGRRLAAISGRWFWAANFVGFDSEAIKYKPAAKLDGLLWEGCFWFIPESSDREPGRATDPGKG